MKINIHEVITDYTNENNYTHIDVYESPDPNSYGKTVAVVCRDTGKVYFTDNLYNNEPQVTEAIKEVVDSLPMNNLKKGQIQGICFAVAEALRNSDQARYAIENWSVSLQDAIDAGVPEFDMETIKDILK